MTFLVYSTLSRDNCYVEHNRGPDGNLTAPLRKVLIKGGSNVVQTDKFSGALHTPNGVVTRISDEDFDFLKTDATFNLHVKNGFIKYESGESSKKIEKIKNNSGETMLITEETPSGLSKKDKSAQKTKDDFVDESGNPLYGKSQGLTGVTPKEKK